MRIALCIPTNGPPTWSLLDSVARWQAYHYHEHPEIAVDVIRPPRALPVDVARTYLAQVVLEQGHDYMWFVDQDCAFVPETLDRLLSWKAPIVGALCMIRGSTYCFPMVFQGRNPDGDTWMIRVNECHEFVNAYYDLETNDPQIVEHVPDGSLFAVDFTGCHCLLVERGVLETLEPPWFSGQPGQEDRNFCFKANEAGIPVYVDLSVLAAHATGTRLIGAWDFMAHFRLYAELGGWHGRSETESSTGVHVPGSAGDSSPGSWVRWTR